MQSKAKQSKAMQSKAMQSKAMQCNAKAWGTSGEGGMGDQPGAAAHFCLDLLCFALRGGSWETSPGWGPLPDTLSKKVRTL
jgi:hypothetical protein